MAYSKFIGHKTVLKASTDKTAASSTAAGVVTLGNLISIGNLPETVREKVPTLVLASTVYECQPGLPGETGAVPVTVAYKQGDSGINKLITMHNKGTVGKFFVVYPTAYGLSDDSFKGFCDKLGGETIEGSQLIRRTLSLQPTSGVAWAT